MAAGDVVGDSRCCLVVEVIVTGAKGIPLEMVEFCPVPKDPHAPYDQPGEEEHPDKALGTVAPPGCALAPFLPPSLQSGGHTLGALLCQVDDGVEKSHCPKDNEKDGDLGLHATLAQIHSSFGETHVLPCVSE